MNGWPSIRESEFRALIGPRIAAAVKLFTQAGCIVLRVRCFPPTCRSFPGPWEGESVEKLMSRCLVQPSFRRKTAAARTTSATTCRFPPDPPISLRK